jgi:hypothetical protein
MPVTPQDRPIDALREETVDQLIMNYGHGKLSLEAFERRLDEALDAKSHDALLALTSDLERFSDKQYAARKRAELGIGAEPPRDARARDDGDEDEIDYMVNVFGGSNRGGAWHVPREIRMFNVFGGAELDFSNARFSAPTTHITVICLFGGASFYVREGINTVSKAICIFGGIDNRAPSSDDRDAPTIVINGLVLFGGADIKIKKTARERFIEFADHVREMFGATAEKPVK